MSYMVVLDGMDQPVVLRCGDCGPELAFFFVPNVEIATTKFRPLRSRFFVD